MRTLVVFCLFSFMSVCTFAQGTDSPKRDVSRKQSFTSLDQVLQGCISGLTVTRNPDGSFSAKIRGLDTVAEALVVLYETPL